MRYPRMNTQRNMFVKVPLLNGGVNMCDAPNHIEDNQLTACKNVWWFNEALQTRPGLSLKQADELPVGATGAVGRFIVSNRISEQEALLGQFRDPPTDGEGGTFWGYSLSLDSDLVCLGKRIGVKHDENVGYSGLGVKASKGSETDYYFYLSDGSILQQGEESAVGAERELVDAEPYVPLVMLNGKGWNGADENHNQTSGVFYEGYNMLTGKYKCTFTTDGACSLFSVPKNNNTKILSVELTVGSGSESRVIALEDLKSGGGWTEIAASEAGEDAKTFYPDETTLEVSYRSGSGEGSGNISFGMRKTGAENAIPWHPPAVVANNLTIVAENPDTTSRSTICRMTQCAWFGGDRSGVNGGTRLFVCGNPDKPNLVHWSDVNNPLYFPENNYAYIGNGDEAVTGFGKQGDLLVIFKEHEIYSAQYVAGTEFTYEDVISGAVTDVSANLAHFPITPLHPNVGCDCPDSIRLVNNRLVWATSDKHVYMLTGVNQWSERNVRDITARIRPNLDSQIAEQLKGAVAGEYKGYYTLLVGKTMYLFDTGNSAFQNYTYYSSDKKAGMLLPWYIWELDCGADEWVTTVSDGERLYLLKQSVYMSTGGGQEWKLYELGGETDDGVAIKSSFCTKLYDFGRMDSKKSINQLYATVKDTVGCRVKVTYLTDRYVAEDACVLKCDGDTDGAMRTFRLTPNVHMVQQFGVRMEAENGLSVSGLLINYQDKGVVR